MRPLAEANRLVEGTAAANTGLGALTLAFFPLAIPAIALTAVALIPVVVLGLAVGLVVAIAAAPLVVVRSLGRRLRHRVRPERIEGKREGPTPAAIHRSAT
jgi:Flp pilus assembly protein TadB